MSSLKVALRIHVAVIRPSLSLRYIYTYYTSISVEGELGVLQNGIRFPGLKRLKLGKQLKLVGRLKKGI